MYSTESLDRLRNDVASVRLQLLKAVRAEVAAESRRILDRLAAVEVKVMDRLDSVEVKVAERLQTKVVERQTSITSSPRPGAKVTYM